MVFNLARFMARSALIGLCATLFLVSACGGGSTGGSSSNSAMNLAGTWTVKTVSTQGQPPYGGFSGTAAVSQSGEGIGVNGATTFTTILGSIAASQTGAALTGTFTNSIQQVSYNFIGTLYQPVHRG